MFDNVPLGDDVESAIADLAAKIHTEKCLRPLTRRFTLLDAGRVQTGIDGRTDKPPGARAEVEQPRPGMIAVQIGELVVRTFELASAVPDIGIRRPPSPIHVRQGGFW
jgi:hypothetical protein